jgi:hypothetical protein
VSGPVQGGQHRGNPHPRALRQTADTHARSGPPVPCRWLGACLNVVLLPRKVVHVMGAVWEGVGWCRMCAFGYRYGRVERRAVADVSQHHVLQSPRLNYCDGCNLP